MAKKKASLGKGLDALLGDNGKQTAINVNTGIANADLGAMREIAISDISASSGQPRQVFEEESLQQLADSIKQHGILQPIIVRTLKPNSYQLIAGERRWRAAQKAGLKTVPAIVNELEDNKSNIVAVLENIQRQNLNPVELSEALRKMQKEQNLAHNDIAKSLSMSRPAVSNLLRLAELSPSIKNMLKEGRLDMGHARAILAVEEKDQLSLAAHTAEKKLSVRQTEALAKKWPLQKAAVMEDTQNRDIDDFARRCSEILLIKVDIQHKPSGHGKLTINYKSLEQLHYLTGKLAPELAEQETQENDNSANTTTHKETSNDNT